MARRKDVARADDAVDATRDAADSPYARTDTLSPAQRSERMSRVRGKDTKPEMIVRRLVHALGYRYRLHGKVEGKYLPGKPDMVFAGRKMVIFVHGCFWHRHDEEKCPLTRWPKSRLDFWKPKLEGNEQRDRDNQAKLREMGWKYLEVWECQVKNRDELARRVREFLESDDEVG